MDRLRKRIASIDITGKMILLGTGTSVGVPALGCLCPVCTGRKERNLRSRASAILGLPRGHLLIDTSPDLRSQLLREGIGIVDAVVYTHEHADHLAGFDDLRLFQFYLGHAVPVYATPHVCQRLRTMFSYAFTEDEQTHVGAVPAVALHPIGDEPFDLLGATIVPVPLKHGPRFDVLGFRIGDVAYCTDTNEIPPSSRERLRGLDTLVLDALRPTPHATHFCIEEAIDVVRDLRPRRTYLTHCSCHVDYYEWQEKLPEGIEIAYDGLQIDLPTN